jgi:Holliday junction resolvase RusA-like endonuclease
VSMWFFVPDRRVRDLDNLQKSILDALNKLVYDDDRQVDEIYAVRDYSPKNPRAVVVVRTL